MLQLFFKRMLKDQRGQDLAEYGMLLALIAIVVIVAVTLLGNGIAAFWTSIVDVFPGV